MSAALPTSITELEALRLFVKDARCLIGRALGSEGDPDSKWREHADGWEDAVNNFHGEDVNSCAWCKEVFDD